MYDAVVDVKYAHAVIVPHKSSRHSLAEYLVNRSTATRKHFHQVTDWAVDQWKLTLSELCLDKVVESRRELFTFCRKLF
jgi:hypothetical protein